MSDLNQLQTFIEVARQQSFSAAGKTLALPRSTVSARIKSLEQRLGARLFLRNTRRVTLTPEGHEYWLQCESALQQLQRAEEQLQGEHSLQGKVTLSIPVAMPTVALAQLMVMFNQRYPALRLSIDVCDSSHDLLTGEIDVAIRGRDPGERDLVARPLASSQQCYVASASWWQQHATSDLVQLQRQLIFAPGKTGPAAPIIANNFDMALQLAMAGAGPALLPVALCEPALTAQRLQRLPFTVVEPLPLYLVYASRQLPRRVRALVDFILAHTEQLLQPAASTER